jgi:hypothetical protein
MLPTHQFKVIQMQSPVTQILGIEGIFNCIHVVFILYIAHNEFDFWMKLLYIWCILFQFYILH